MSNRDSLKLLDPIRPAKASLKFRRVKGASKGISIPVGILIILICALLVGGILVWQYKGMVKETKLPEIKAPTGEMLPPPPPPEEELPEKIVPEEETADLSSEPLAEENWQTYTNEEYSFELKYPAHLLLPEGLEEGSEWEDIIVSIDMGVATFMMIEKLEIQKGQDFSEVLIENTQYDPSMRHPQGLEDFKLIKLGENMFYYIKIGLGGGIANYNYYLIKEPIIFKFIISSNVSLMNWSDPDFDVEKDDKNHLMFREILSTFRFLE